MNSAAVEPVMSKLRQQLRARIRGGEMTCGTFLNLGSAVATEVAGIAGFDWAIVDLEHGSGSEATLLSQLQALQLRRVVSIVRVEAIDPPRFSFALDRGADGVMVPGVESAGQARAALAFMHYPPEGRRGVAFYNRAWEFGRHVDHRTLGSYEPALGVIQIETLGALDEVREIAALDGVDVLFVGPVDLGHALGIPGDTEHPRLRDALRMVIAATQEAGKGCGLLVPSAAAAADWLAMGVRFIAVGSDSSLMLAGMSDAVDVMRSAHTA